MNKLITILFSAALMVASSWAKPFTLELDETGPLSTGASLITTTFLIDEDGTNDGSIAFGVEGRFGQSFQSLEEVGIALAHMDNEDADTTRLYVYANDQYDMGLSFFPFVGLGVGYGWADPDDAEDLESILLFFEGGIRYPLNENMIINLSARIGIADTDFYIEDDGVNDKNLELGVGVSFQY